MPSQSGVFETGCIYGSVSCNIRSIDHNVSAHATQTYISKARTTIDKKRHDIMHFVTVCDRSLAGIVGLNPAGGMAVCLL
jgi:hypothetical protein